MKLISKKTLESLQAWITLEHCGARAIRHIRPILQADLALNLVIFTGFGGVQLILEHCNQSSVKLKNDKDMNTY